MPNSSIPLPYIPLPSNNLRKNSSFSPIVATSAWVMRARFPDEPELILLNDGRVQQCSREL